MAYRKYSSPICYTALMDVAKNCPKPRSFFDTGRPHEDEVSYQTYLSLYNEAFRETGARLPRDFHTDARQIVEYELGSKPFIEIYQLGQQVALCEVEIPSAKVHLSFSADQLRIYNLGLLKESNLRCYPEHFPLYLRDAAQALAIRALTLDCFANNTSPN